MKIKTWVNNVIAVIALLTLVSGFQINVTPESPLQSAAVSIETAIGVEEAYAGPCGRRGCDGTNTYCGTYTVLEIGGIHVVRHCDGKIKSTEKDVVEFL